MLQRLREIFDTMGWPLAACVLTPALFVFFGLHLLRRQSFFPALLLPQLAALGGCIAFFQGAEPGDSKTFLYTLGASLGGAIFLTIARRLGSHVSAEALAASCSAVVLAATLVILGRLAEGDGELRRLLVGQVLLATPSDVWKVLGIFAGCAVPSFLLHKRFLASPVETPIWAHFLFFVLLSVLVATFSRMGGVCLIFAFLLLPAFCGDLIFASFLGRFITGWVVAAAAAVPSVGIAFKLDLPTGAAIAGLLAGFLFLAVIISLIKHRRKSDSASSQKS